MDLGGEGAQKAGCQGRVTILGVEGPAVWLKHLQCGVQLAYMAAGPACSAAWAPPGCSMPYALEHGPSRCACNEEPEQAGPARTHLSTSTKISAPFCHR